MAFTRKTLSLYFGQLSGAKQSLDNAKVTSLQDLTLVSHDAHKILGTAMVFGDLGLSDICQKIDSDANFLLQTSEQSSQFLEIFESELTQAIEKVSTVLQTMPEE